MPNTNGISGTNNNKNSKPRTEQPNLVVLTYSVLPTIDATLSTLNKNGASAHYIIEEDGNQIQFTNDATDQTFCCGKSEFRSQTSLNQISINIMLINDAQSVFKQAQITKLIAFFQDLAKRYPHLDLKKDIVGLGEVAIQKDQPAPRHIAPGRFFPWEQLAQQGFGLFLATTPEQKAEICISPESSELEILTLQNKLRDYGYAIEASGKYDDSTKAWVTRFNQHYVPDATQQLDASLWSKASHLSLEHTQQYSNAKTNTATQSASLQSSFFNQDNIPAANTNRIDEVIARASTFLDSALPTSKEYLASIPFSETLTLEMATFSYERTQKHRDRVLNNIQVFLQQEQDLKQCLSLDDTCLTDIEFEKFKTELIQRGENHDRSKFIGTEKIAYIYINWKHHQEKDLKQEYAYPNEMNQEKIDQAIQHHWQVNPHHANYFLIKEDGSLETNEVEIQEKLKNMMDADLIEMVADWMALSQEYHTHCKEFAENNIGENKRWPFSQEQKTKIFMLIDILERALQAINDPSSQPEGTTIKLAR